METPKSVRSEIGDLQHPARRHYHANALVKIGGPAIEALCLTLGDKNPEICAIAAWALGEIGDARAVEALCQALRHPDDDVRFQAVWALGKLADARAVKPLCEVLADGNHVIRQMAAWTLGNVGDLHAVVALGLALQDPNGLVRSMALAALNQLAGGSSLPRRLVTEESLSIPERYAALQALGADLYCFHVTRLLIDERNHASDAKVRDAATALLEYAARAEVEEERLVRPSAPVEEQSLLRPAAGSEDATPPKRLARSAEAPPASDEKQARRRWPWHRKD